MLAIAKLAKLLKTTEEVILDLDRKMTRISGRPKVIERIIHENNEKVKKTLKALGFDSRAELSAEKVYQSLLKKAEETDQSLFNHFHQPDFSSVSGCRGLLNAAKELVGDLTGFYLKAEKARELLLLNPPKKIMVNLGYGTDIDKMMAQEDVFEIFCALRFVEDEDWLNNIFFKPYQDLKKSDFEERKIRVMVLPEKWQGIGKKFLKKKLHHMSHLKELGIVFIIPVDWDIKGETLYTFFMTLHYLYEVEWHARLFKKYSQGSNFSRQMIAALRVGVSELPLPDQEKMSWRIVPKYLAKKNSNDWRLAEPHLSPEAWHYCRAGRAITQFSQRFPALSLDFWQGLDTVADYFFSQDNGEELVSFDLFDNGICLLQEKGFESKYLYHQAEALWNKIFTTYLGEEKTDNLMMDNLEKGYIVL